jgi:hypothetical protein
MVNYTMSPLLFFPKQNSLFLTFHCSFTQPTKRQVIHMLNLVSQTHTDLPMSISYAYFENNRPLYNELVSGKVKNMKILNNLASNDYIAREIEIKALINELK